MKALRLAVTGFVSIQAGSVASANALLIQGLLRRGCEVEFFSKASFVDPRPSVGRHERFCFINVDNRLTDRARAAVQKVPIVGTLAGQVDAASYNRLLVRTINCANADNHFDLCLWLGDYARGRIPGVPGVSFAQGPPGTDARSIADRFAEIQQLAGPRAAWKWRFLAAVRQSPPGRPPLQYSDRIIVGSSQSAGTLRRLYGIPGEKISTLPYPVDLELFRPQPGDTARPLRCLWLGRVVPRKRLDLFLDGAAVAIRSGADVRLTIVGGIGFVPGYEKLIEAFPFPDRLQWKKSVAREKVPALLQAHDVLVQPSEEENFGSSVAEAQACGLPVIVGATNGNADYLCPRDIHLADNRPETLAAALGAMAQRKSGGRWGDPVESRRCAEEHFDLDTVTDRLLEILRKT